MQSGRDKLGQVADITLLPGTTGTDLLDAVTCANNSNACSLLGNDSDMTIASQPSFALDRNS